MLKRRPALGTEDVTGADARATDRAALIVRHPRRRGDGPRTGGLGLDNCFVAGRGAPGGPHRLVVPRLWSIQGALPRIFDLTRPAVTIVHQGRLSVSGPWFLGVGRSHR